VGFGFLKGIRMKLVVFAQTPPPLHGQSYMVELLVRGMAENDLGIEVFHVNAQFATSSEDIGRFRIAKIFRLFGYCFRAIAFRFMQGARALYYVPSPPVRNPLYRDWMILLLLRPFFRNIILHWHAAGLGEWIERQSWFMRKMTQLALGRARLSISLGRFNEKDAAVFRPRNSVVVANGIPDPCPNFAELQANRRQRLQPRVALWNSANALPKNSTIVVRVLFMSLCSREKGLFDAIEGVCQANRLCRSDHLPMEFELTIAGSFPDDATQTFLSQTFERLGAPKTIRHIGFADTEMKKRLLADCDILCFPTYYYGESFGLVILEAMAFGMPILTTRWRSLPDLLPPNYPGLVDIQSPDQISEALFHLALRDDTEEFRRTFLNNYTAEKFLANIAAAIRSVESKAPAT
jgi:glycosyltransferase involved in cell wall biosynthesis